jgi:DNA primase
MRIADETIERVREATDIVAVVGEVVTLRQSGRNHMGLCPFHEERTPSFSVSQERGIFHCFGCGKGGDAFAFLMETQGIGFVDAVRLLAERAGIPIAADKTESGVEQLYRLNAAAARFFQEVLLRRPEGANARRYARDRGLTRKTAEAFGIGAAPDAWSAFSDLALREEFSLEILRKSGLVVDRKQNKGYYDRFRNRLIFPIRAATGRVVAFGGRRLADSNEPKYINSPETPIYRKGEHLFGLYAARQAIREARAAIVVEGYTDCLAMHRAGLCSCVAALGTAFTPEQAKLLRRYADQVILVFDADAAGHAASVKGMGVLLACGLDVRVAALPVGQDPDSLLLSEGAEALRAAVAVHQDAIEASLAPLTEALHGASPAARVRIVQPVLDAIAAIPNSAVKSAYVEQVAGRIRSDPRALARALVGSKGQPRGSSSRQSVVPLALAPAALEPGVRDLLRLALSDVAAQAFSRVSAGSISDPSARRAYTLLGETVTAGGAPNLPRVLEQLDDPALAAALTEIAAASVPTANLQQLLEDVARHFERKRAAEQRWALNRALDEATDPARRREILRELSDLLRKSAGSN